MFHYRKNRSKHRALSKIEGCAFCDEEKLARPKIKQAKYYYITPNAVFYDLWELRDVGDHLLVIPNRHVKSLNELTKAEKAEIIDIVSQYESEGYNIYARAVNSKQRSVAHQHTHLIKTKEKQARGSIFIKKPYWLKKI